jgi:hypothetical protein
VASAESGTTIRVRVTLVSPPPGVSFAIQGGRDALLPPTAVLDDGIHFDFTLRLGSPRPDAPFNFLGEFAQGPPADRFVYINSGTFAGQPESPWSRRAKLKLASAPSELVEQAVARRDLLLEARVAGTIGDGGPICATVRPHAVVWQVTRDLG